MLERSVRMKTSAGYRKRSSLAAIVAAGVLAFSLAACSPQAAGDSSRPADDSSAVTPASIPWSQESDCSACHVDEFQSASAGDALYSIHSSLDGMGSCIDCHDDSDALSSAHEGYMDEKARLPKKLKETSVSEETCIASGCHVTEDLVAKTADSVALTDAEGTVVNPHSMVTDGNHKVGGSAGADIQCSTCHKMHAVSGTDSAEVVEAASARCKSCHHSDVYECGTCHE